MTRSKNQHSNEYIKGNEVRKAPLGTYVTDDKHAAVNMLNR